MAYSNPAEAAMPYFNAVPGTLKPYYSPYISAGTGALSDLQKQYRMLLDSPESIMNLVGSKYQQSPGYQYQFNQGMNAANNAAAAGGMLGTPAHQEEAARTAEDIANQDYYNFINHALQQYGLGLQGEQGLNQMGYGASTDLATSLANNLMSQGSLAYQGQAEKNKANADFWKTMLGGGVGLAENLIPWGKVIPDTSNLNFNF